MKPITLLLQSLWCIAISGLPLESDESSRVISRTLPSSPQVGASIKYDFSITDWLNQREAKEHEKEKDYVMKNKKFDETSLRKFPAFSVRLLQRLVYGNANR